MQITSYYFIILWRRFQRKSEEIGLPASLSLTLALIGVVVLWYLLISKTSYHSLWFACIGVMLSSKELQSKGYPALHLHFSRKHQVIFELGLRYLIIAPFLSILLLHQHWKTALVVALIIPALHYIQLPRSFIQSLPSPFGKANFEMSIALRKWFYLYIGLGIILFQAYAVTNTNLALVCIACIYLLILFSYTINEDRFYVWIYNLDVKNFLLTKWKSALINSSLFFTILWVLTMPAFQLNWYVPILYHVVFGYSLLLWILLKYAFHPSEPPMAFAILFCLSVVFPPFGFYFIALCFRKSKDNLLYLLEC